MKNNEEMVHLNTRIPQGMKRTYKALAAAAGLKLEDLNADALRFFIGQTDPTMESRRQKVLETFKHLYRGRRPFESPTVLLAA